MVRVPHFDHTGTMELPSAHLDRRRHIHAALAARLAALSDDEFAVLLAETNAWRANGNGNQGHDYGTHLTSAQRWALIEYLKTL